MPMLMALSPFPKFVKYSRCFSQILKIWNHKVLKFLEFEKKGLALKVLPEFKDRTGKEKISVEVLTRFF